MRLQVVYRLNNKVRTDMVHAHKDDNILDAIELRLPSGYELISIELQKEIIEIYDYTISDGEKDEHFIASVEGYGLTGYEQSVNTNLYWSYK